MTKLISLCPADLPEARDAVADLAARRQRVLVRGAGTASDWAGPVSGVDAVLETTGLNQVLDYRPQDMTVAVQAGIPVATLQQVLAGHGQWLALDAARVAAGATVGGMLATADAGPRRHSYGGLRDLVLGATVLLADGTVARSGGHVIKNVAGYDLAKLFSGSYGTLGMVAELVLRVHPLPAASGTATVACDLDRASSLAAGIMAEPLEPAAIQWCAGRLLVRFTGHPAGTADQCQRAAAILGDDADVVTGSAEDRAWQPVADTAAGAPGDTVLHAGMLPTRLPQAAAGLAALAAGHEVRLSLSASLGVGVLTALLRGGTATAHGAIVDTWRGGLGTDGTAVSLRRRCEGFDAHAPSWGPPPSSVSALRAIKRAFDPENRLGPGRFAPWF